MSAITTHVLDAVLGKPAADVPIRLEIWDGEAWALLSSDATDVDGRVRDLAPAACAGVYRLTFSTADYLERMGRTTLYPEISVTFTCGGEAHYHLPLLLSDNSYTTYRGS